MYPTISDLLNDLFGFYLPLPIQSFGFFVAIAFLTAAYFFGKELQRKEEEGLLKAETNKVMKGKPATTGELAVSGLVGFLLGFKLLFVALNYAYFVDNPQQAILSLQGNFFGGLIGAGLIGWMKYREKQKERLEKPQLVEETMHPHQHIGNITLLAALFGLIGAKIFHLLENPDEVKYMFESVQSFFSGLTMYGGLLFGGVAVIIYARKHKMMPLHVMDAAAPALMLAYGIGRIGCQMAGDGDWGIVNNLAQPGWLSFLPEWFWKFDYPHNVINAGVPIEGCEGAHCSVLPEAVFPTPLYEVMMSIGIFFVLWGFRKKIKIPGIMFCLYLVFNGLERFLIEKIRVNEVTQMFGMEVTQAEIISTILFLAGVFGIWYFKKNKTKFA